LLPYPFHPSSWDGGKGAKKSVLIRQIGGPDWGSTKQAGPQPRFLMSDGRKLITLKSAYGQRTCRTTFSTHGLRKNAEIMLAENGATVPQIIAALGHRTPKMALYYCRLANQKPIADQAADIPDIAFGERAERRQSKVALHRARFKIV
jgi:hypothetical protein